MNAITYDRFGGLDVLHMAQLGAPAVRPNDLLIRVNAVSVNPIDSKIRRGELRLLSGSRFPKTPGSDFAGVVEAKGSAVTGFVVGDRVFGFSGRMREGTLAEQISVDAGAVAKIPPGLHYVEAAAISTVGLAALQALRDVGRVQAGERVLVNGATGGVGLMLVQLAHKHGAKVVAVGSKAGLELARQLGADEVSDYRAVRVATQAEPFDVVFDLSTKLPFSEARSLLAPRGRHVGFEPSPLALLGSMLLNPFRQQKQRLLITKPSANDLQALAHRVATGELAPPPVQVFELSDARQAYDRAEQGGVVGKVVIRMTADARTV